MNSSILISAIALMLIIEGCGPLLFPNRWKNFMLTLAKQPSTVIRQIGLALCLFGSILLFLNS